MKLPEVIQQPILYVDGTPDEGYVLRILLAYRENCNCRWVSTIDETEEAESPLLKLMNEHCEQRARLLNRAIAILEGVPLNSNPIDDTPLGREEREGKRILLYLKELLKCNPKASLEATIDLIETTNPESWGN